MAIVRQRCSVLTSNAVWLRIFPMPLKDIVYEAARQRRKGFPAADREADLPKPGLLQRDGRQLPASAFYDQLRLDADPQPLFYQSKDGKVIIDGITDIGT